MSIAFRVVKILPAAGILASAFVPLAARAADVGAEVANARTHAGLAAQATDVATVHMHLHHAVNCLVGPQGTGFDAKELNPCQNDGNGAIPDTTGAAGKASLQAAAARAEAGIAANSLSAARKAAADAAAMLNTSK